MPLWEYQFVAAQYERDEWRPRYVNGKELPDWERGPSLYDYANQLGMLGWELVAAPYTHSDLTPESALIPRLIFKRPHRR